MTNINRTILIYNHWLYSKLKEQFKIHFKLTVKLITGSYYKIVNYICISSKNKNLNNFSIYKSHQDFSMCTTKIEVSNK